MDPVKPCLVADPETRKGRGVQSTESYRRRKPLEELNPTAGFPIPLKSCMYLSPSVSHSSEVKVTGVRNDSRLWVIHQCGCEQP